MYCRAEARCRKTQGRHPTPETSEWQRRGGDVPFRRDFTDCREGRRQRSAGGRTSCCAISKEGLWAEGAGVKDRRRSRGNENVPENRRGGDLLWQAGRSWRVLQKWMQYVRVVLRYSLLLTPRAQRSGEDVLMMAFVSSPLVKKRRRKTGLPSTTSPATRR